MKKQSAKRRHWRDPASLNLVSGWDTSRLQLGFKLSQARVESLVALPAHSHVLNTGGCAQDVPVSRLGQRNVEFDRDSSPILRKRGNGEHALAVLGDSGLHHMEVALPVPRPVLYGNDRLHGLAEHFLSTPPEHGFRAGIPEPHIAFPIRENDRERDLFHNAFTELLLSRDVIHLEIHNIPNTARALDTVTGGRPLALRAARDLD